MDDLPTSDELLSILALGLLVPAVASLHWVVFKLLGRRDPRILGGSLHSFSKHCRRPTLIIAVAAALSIGLGTVPLPSDWTRPAQHALALVLIGAMAWLIVRLTAVAGDALLVRFDVGQRDNRVARRIHTQALVMQRIASVVVGVLAIAVMLTTFPQVRVMGASILASAGVAGLVIGLAAQSTLSNLLAGIQIAMTDPLRIDDVVVVEGEWGRIEEISFTYVVVRIWDERRLILPISYFTTRPFENWTRGRSEILGSVTVRVDYSVPVEELRKELTRLVEASPLWDRRVAVLQVTEASERTIELRALVSSADSSSAWDLRCAVREGLIGFLQTYYPETLPRTRAEILGTGVDAVATASGAHPPRGPGGQ